MTIDAGELRSLADTFRREMAAASGAALDARLTAQGWPELLAEYPDQAVPLVFRLLGETGAHAPVLNDVVLAADGLPVGGTVALPFADGSSLVWARSDDASSAIAPELPLARTDSAAVLSPAALAAGRRAAGWWLAGTSRAMLTLARQHVLDRVQFGRPLASFQAVRHRLAETLVAVEGAEAALGCADSELGALLAKAAAGQAALTAARHCQQVLGGIGFTAEHAHHGHYKRALVLDDLFGNARRLTREAGALLLKERTAPRLAQL